jgi:phage gp46-like protein
MADRYQGDPKLILDENGADLVFTANGGQPEMDRGLENAALISLHTRPGWAGNILFRKPSEQIGSDFEQANRDPITLTSFNNIRNAAQAALQWMVDTGVAASVEARVSNPTGRRVQTAVLIKPPSRDPLVLLETRNGLNWISQKIDPANLRVP